jgi:DNA-binding NarL/FixJ family response regulator
VIRVVLVDDQELMRVGFRMVLGAQEDMEIVGEAGDGKAAVALAGELRPDVVLMDVRMPDVDGIRATEQLLRTMAAPPRIVVVTTFENDSYVYDALRAGAAGFLLKRSAAADLVQAVRLVARTDSLLYPAAVRALAAEHARSHRTTTLRARLTDREADVLRLMAQGLANAEIATRLDIGAATVKSHVAAVLAKLGARDRTQAVIAAYESGFVTPG